MGDFSRFGSVLSVSSVLWHYCFGDIHTNTAILTAIFQVTVAWVFKEISEDAGDSFTRVLSKLNCVHDGKGSDIDFVQH